jgi:hypothetical protein
MNASLSTDVETMAAQQVMSPGRSCCTLVVSLCSAFHAALILPLRRFAGRAYALTRWHRPAEHAPAITPYRLIAKDFHANLPRRDGLTDRTPHQVMCYY